MKVNISIVDVAGNVVGTFKVSKTERIDRDTQAFQLEMLRDGSWKLLYDKNLFPSVSRVSMLHFTVEDEDYK